MQVNDSKISSILIKKSLFIWQSRQLFEWVKSNPVCNVCIRAYSVQSVIVQLEGIPFDPGIVMGRIVMGTGTWVWVPDCSRWDRYLGMTAAMTQVPVPTARMHSILRSSQHPLLHQPLRIPCCRVFQRVSSRPTHARAV